jgi:hypothetical protein
VDAKEIEDPEKQFMRFQQTQKSCAAEALVKNNCDTKGFLTVPKRWLSPTNNLY